MLAYSPIFSILNVGREIRCGMQNDIKEIHQYYYYGSWKSVTDRCKYEGIALKEHIVGINSKVHDINGNREYKHGNHRGKKLLKGVNVSKSVIPS